MRARPQGHELLVTCDLFGIRPLLSLHLITLSVGILISGARVNNARNIAIEKHRDPYDANRPVMTVIGVSQINQVDGSR
ncbi:hypothetical protein QWA68_006059 [Fusarium oxysporum]|nr:hypothetical protein QWA68_006059 [Fusarium oxysporum]